jgi:Carboxypeptidase regulatory-like domain
MLDRNLIKVLIFLYVAGPVWTQTPTGTVSGRVANLLAGSPVRKAQVILLGDQNPNHYEAVTDTDGKYSIAGVAPGRYRLSVQRQGFLSVAYGASGPNRPGKSVVIGAGETKKDLNFAIEPPGVITGHVYDEEGEPLSIQVELRRQTWTNGHRVLRQAGGVMANDEGEYRIYGLPAGSYVVSTLQNAPRNFLANGTVTFPRDVYASTFYPGSEDLAGATLLRVAPGSEAEGIDFHLRKTTAVDVKGTVAAQSPDQQFVVTMTRRDGLNTSRNTATGRDFLMQRIVPGAYVLTATSTGPEPRYSGTLNIDTGTLDVNGVQIPVSPEKMIPGVVQWEGETRPKGEFTVTLSRVLPAGMEQGNRFTAKADGHFQWENARPGTWLVDVTPLSDGMYLKFPREIEVGPDFSGPLEIVVSAQGAQVSGKVQVSEGKPVEAATVLVVAEGGPPRVAGYAVSDAAGTYKVEGLPPGKYRMIAVEDIETLSWQDPSVAAGFEGKGVPVELAPSAKVSQDLTPGINP